METYIVTIKCRVKVVAPNGMPKETVDRLAIANTARVLEGRKPGYWDADNYIEIEPDEGNTEGLTIIPIKL